MRQYSPSRLRISKRELKAYLRVVAGVGLGYEESQKENWKLAQWRIPA